MTATSLTAVALPAARPHARPRASWAEVGGSRLALLLVGLNGLTLLVAVGLFASTGVALNLAAKASWADVGMVGLGLLVWAYYVWTPGSPREWIIPQAALVFALLQTAAVLLAPMQYAAGALARPTIDPLLAQADAALGVSVPALVAWTAGHPWLVALLHWAYFTLLYQLFLPVVALAWWQDSEALWEFAFHMIVAGLVTITVFAFWPAACVFSELHFTSLIDQTRFLAHFAALRDGTLTAVPWGNIEDLVSAPSFHVAGAAIVTWACRRTWLVWGLLPINLLLTAATVLLGAHYLVDLLASGAMLAGSLLLYRWLYRRL